MNHILRSYGWNLAKFCVHIDIMLRNNWIIFREVNFSKYNSLIPKYNIYMHTKLHQKTPKLFEI